MNSEYQALLATLREEEKDVVDNWLDEAQLVDAGARRAAQTEATDILRQLRDALQAAVDHPGPYLLNVMVTPFENVYPMVPAGGAINEMVLAPPTPVEA